MMKADEGHKLVSIEVLRFLCALSVLVWHYQHFYFDPATASFAVERSQQPLYWLLHPFYDFGWLGVNFFWSISGFIFFHNYRLAIEGGAVSPQTFFVRRFSRLYPLHLATLLAVAALQYLVYRPAIGTFFVYEHNSAPDFVLQLLFASGWTPSHADAFNAPIWSVSTEILVYVLFFLLARHLRLGMIQTLALVVLSGAAGTVLIRYQVKGNVSNIVFCCFYFFVGGGVDLILKRFAAPTARYRAALTLGSGLFCLAALGFFATIGFTKYLFATVLAPMSIFFLCVSEPYVPRGLGRKIAFLGSMTYSSYLVHFPLQIIAASILPTRDYADRPGFLLVYLAVVLVVAAGVYRWFEVPAQDFLRRRFPAKAPQ